MIDLAEGPSALSSSTVESFRPFRFTVAIFVKSSVTLSCFLGANGVAVMNIS